MLFPSATPNTTLLSDRNQGMWRPGGVADPLAGIVFALRLQTHKGDNVPLGLWQDTAGTIPAVLDGDPVARWDDVLGTSGLSALQANTMQQPLLRFVNGTPVVRFDGVDDQMVVTTPVVQAQPNLVSVAGIADVSANHGRFVDTSSGARQILNLAVNTGLFSIYAGGSQVDGINDRSSNYHVFTADFDSSSESFVDGLPEVSGSAGNNALQNPNLGNQELDGDIVAVLVTASTASRALIDSTLATLLPV